MVLITVRGFFARKLGMKFAIGTGQEVVIPKARIM